MLLHKLCYYINYGITFELLQTGLVKVKTGPYLEIYGQICTRVTAYIISKLQITHSERI